MIKVIEVIN